MHKNRTISYESTILEALKKMDELDKKLLIVLDQNKFYGLLSVGDVQRAIIKDKPLQTKVREILRENIRIASRENSFDEIKQMMFDYRMELCPVVNNDKEIVEVYFWEEVFQDKQPHPKRSFNLPVVIMAGGKGTRMRPLTYVLPKPLIPVGDKTILESIFFNFEKHGSTRFYISINYKSDFIEFYLNDLNLPYTIDFFKEPKPLGTAGSLSLLKGKIKERFFVTNCDILIEEDYSEILQYHCENHNEITIIAALKHYPIPYGTIETGDNGQLKELTEKPELTFKINSGMYILEPHLLDEIPTEEFFHITHLIDKVNKRKGRVGVYPVSEKSWKDIGVWDEYLKNNHNEN